MVRVGGPVDASTESTGTSPLGPILLHHGAFTDGISWMNGWSADRELLPIALKNLGYDVYIGNKRGTRMSPFTNTLADSVNYDFSHDEIATDDLPSMINKILQTRLEEDGTQCMKVNLLTNSLGGAEAFIMAAELP